MQEGNVRVGVRVFSASRSSSVATRFASSAGFPQSIVARANLDLFRFLHVFYPPIILSV